MALVVCYHGLLSHIYAERCTDGMELEGAVQGRDGKPGYQDIG